MFDALEDPLSMEIVSAIDKLLAQGHPCVERLEEGVRCAYQAGDDRCFIGQFYDKDVPKHLAAATAKEFLVELRPDLTHRLTEADWDLLGWLQCTHDDLAVYDEAESFKRLLLQNSISLCRESGRPDIAALLETRRAEA